jgi:hypothetical protein
MTHIPEQQSHCLSLRNEIISGPDTSLETVTQNFPKGLTNVLQNKLQIRGRTFYFCGNLSQTLLLQCSAQTRLRKCPVPPFLCPQKGLSKIYMKMHRFPLKGSLPPALINLEVLNC